MEKQEERSSRILLAFLALGSVFLSATGWLYWLSTNLPPLQQVEQQSQDQGYDR